MASSLHDLGASSVAFARVQPVHREVSYMLDQSISVSLICGTDTRRACRSQSASLFRGARTRSGSRRVCGCITSNPPPDFLTVLVIGFAKRIAHGLLLKPDIPTIRNHHESDHKRKPKQTPQRQHGNAEQGDHKSEIHGVAGVAEQAVFHHHIGLIEGVDIGVATTEETTVPDADTKPENK